MPIDRTTSMQGSRNKDTDTLQELFRALDQNDLYAAQQAYDTLKQSASGGFSATMLLNSGEIGPVPLPVLGITRNEAEDIGAYLHDQYHQTLRDREELPRGDYGWADLVQHINYQTRKVLEARECA